MFNDSPFASSMVLIRIARQILLQLQHSWVNCFINFNISITSRETINHFQVFLCLSMQQHLHISTSLFGNHSTLPSIFLACCQFPRPSIAFWQITYQSFSLRVSQIFTSPLLLEGNHSLLFLLFLTITRFHLQELANYYFYY